MTQKYSSRIVVPGTNSQSTNDTVSSEASTEVEIDSANPSIKSKEKPDKQVSRADAPHSGGEKRCVRIQTTQTKQKYIMGKLFVVSTGEAVKASQVRLPIWMSKTNDPQGREIMLRIAPRTYVSKSSLSECTQLINDVMPAILPGEKYTLQDLVGDEYWLARTVYQRINLGITWCWLVAEGHTPFKPGDFTCRTPKRYKR